MDKQMMQILFVQMVMFQRLLSDISDVPNSICQCIYLRRFSICLPSKYNFCRSNSQLQHKTGQSRVHRQLRMHVNTKNILTFKTQMSERVVEGRERKSFLMQSSLFILLIKNWKIVFCLHALLGPFHLCSEFYTQDLSEKQSQLTLFLCQSQKNIFKAFFLVDFQNMFLFQKILCPILME